MPAQLFLFPPVRQVRLLAPEFVFGRLIRGEEANLNDLAVFDAQWSTPGCASLIPSRSPLKARMIATQSPLAMKLSAPLMLNVPRDTSIIFPSMAPTFASPL
jgi:hypothetical protein